MRLEARSTSWGIFLPWLKPLAVLLLLASAVAVPLWLYQSRGRKVPLEVLLEAPRYVVVSGQTLELRGRVLPAGREVTRRWSGPGTASAGQASVLRWSAPSKPGLYTVTLAARHAGSRAEDAITLRVIAAPLEGYPLERPKEPSTGASLSALSPCDPPLLAALDKALSLEIHGEVCVGARVVVQAKLAAGAPPVAVRGWRHGTRRGEGAWAEVRMIGAERDFFVDLVPKAARCRVSLKRTLKDAAGCETAARAAKGLVVDFNWQLRGPREFVLTARPPRPPSAAVYRWTLLHAANAARSTPFPRLVHRFGEARRHYVVRLTVEAGPRRASAVRLLRDRGFSPPPR